MGILPGRIPIGITTGTDTIMSMDMITSTAKNITTARSMVMAIAMSMATAA
ncbi:hypothetical protein YSY43_49830 [Paenibacillus sp. YSY-4.3]